jgi:hypothetical protein
VRLLVFCEAAGDFRTVVGLVDRVVREESPRWAREHRPLDDLRQWVGDGLDSGLRAFLDEVATSIVPLLTTRPPAA